jgi:hypothetical protein
MIRNRKWLATVVGLVISAVFLGFAFRGMKPEEVWAQIQNVNIPLLLFAAVWYFAAVAMIALRWRFLLRAFRPIPLRKLIPLVCVGYAGNNIYPFRSGEILRIVLLQRHYGVPFARATTTVLIERVFDGLVMLTFILFTLPFLNISSPEVRTIANVTAPLFLAALVVFFALAARPDILRRLMGVSARVLPNRLGDVVHHLGDEIIAGFKGLRSPLDLAGTVVSSYASWGLEASVYWLVALAFGLDVTYPLLLLVVGVVNLAGLIPASPGQFGVFEFMVFTVMMAAGVASGTAQAYALVVHMVIWLPVTVVGLIFLARYGLGLGAITHAQQQTLEGTPV